MDATKLPSVDLLSLYNGEIPELCDWVCPPEYEYFTLENDNDMVRAKYKEFLGINDENSILPYFIIKKNHFIRTLPDILQHTNYFLNFYDKRKEFFMAIFSIKYIIDQRPNLSVKAFKKLIVDKVLTPTYIANVKAMANNLYTININTDKDGKFKTTPKISNDQARLLVAISFCLRMIMPICIHYSNENSSFVNKKDYIPCFDKVFMQVIAKFEEDDVKCFSALCNFVKYRVYRSYNADKGTWSQKKQLYGITKEIYLEEVIHEVILVKSLHKLKYNKSCVSFIDGIIFSYNRHFKSENYKSKPFEISAEDLTNESDDYLSHAEAMEMANYKIDESNSIINDINNANVLEDLKRRFNVPVTEEELDFYSKNCNLNQITQFLLHSFYSKYFKSSEAIYILNRKDTILLLVMMKKYLHLKGMVLLSQICTANVKGKFKENIIKNSKFIEKMKATSVYQNIIQTKFRYLYELDPKDDKILRKLSTIINSTFIFVDFDPSINGIEYNDINTDVIVDEFLLFLSII